MREALPSRVGRRGLLAAGGVLGVVLGVGGCEPLTASQGSTAEPAETPEAAPEVVFPLEEGPMTFHVELARTEAERAKGLGGHDPLGPEDGMLFVFAQAAPHAFWMKGMTFPLDIMWIEDGQVVHLEHDLPPSGPEETDATRPVFVPQAPARYVLEVNAGFAEAHGIGVGSPVELSGI
jgi:uncharacterized protein